MEVVSERKWPVDTPVREKIYGPVENLQHAVACIWATRVPVWGNAKKEETKMEGMQRSLVLQQERVQKRVVMCCNRSPAEHLVLQQERVQKRVVMCCNRSPAEHLVLQQERVQKRVVMCCNRSPAEHLVLQQERVQKRVVMCCNRSLADICYCFPLAAFYLFILLSPLLSPELEDIQVEMLKLLLLHTDVVDVSTNSVT